MLERNTLLALNILCLFFWASPGQAQNTPKVEVFGGYSYFPAAGAPDAHGFNVSVTTNLNQYMGLTADFSAHFATGELSPEISIPPLPGPGFRGQIRIYELYYGPRLRLLKRRRMTVSGHSLVGLSHVFRHIFPRRASLNFPSRFPTPVWVLILEARSMLKSIRGSPFARFAQTMYSLAGVV